MSCPHCPRTKLKAHNKKGRRNVFVCPKCKCIFCFVIVNMSVKCARKIIGDKVIGKSLTKNRKKRKKVLR